MPTCRWPFAQCAGAVTFLQKPCADKGLWASIETALRWAQRSQRSRARRNEILARRATLTPPEVQVLEKLMAGKANKVVASELDLSLRQPWNCADDGDEKDARRFAG